MKQIIMSMQVALVLLFGFAMNNCSEAPKAPVEAKVEAIQVDEVVITEENALEEVEKLLQELEEL